jgi:sugar/nucleoside kinase (ribokinase family)
MPSHQLLTEEDVDKASDLIGSSRIALFQNEVKPEVTLHAIKLAKKLGVS